MTRLGFVVLVLSACGRLGFDDGTSPDGGGTPGLVPPVMCQANTWSTLPFVDPDVDVSVVQTPIGVTVVWVAEAGGDVTAVNFDTAWNITAGPVVTKAGTFRRVDATMVDDTLVIAETNFNLTDLKIDAVTSDLGGTSELTCPFGQLASSPPMLKAGPDRISAVTTDIGMDVIPFDASFLAMSSQLSVPSDASPIGMTATAVGATVEVVWSTPTTCYVEQLMDLATGLSASTSLPCASPHLASNGVDAALVFEAPGGVYLSRGAPMAISPSTAILLAPGGNSPRITYDGQRFWITYRDPTGKVVIGYIASDGRFLATPMATTTMHDAYELTLINGAPWLFSADSNALTGQRFCIPSS